MGQIAIDFTKAVHVRENNRQSEDHLNQNRQKFTGQCAIVLALLMQGHRLTSYRAMTSFHIGHLPRRIKDLKDAGVPIKDEFEKSPDGKATRNKVWFLDSGTVITLSTPDCEQGTEAVDKSANPNRLPVD